MPIDSAVHLAYQRGKYHEVIKKLKTSSDNESLSLLAECYSLTSQHDQAESIFKTLIQSNPKDASTYYNLGVFYSHQGKPNDAYLCYVNAWECDNTYIKAGETLVRMLLTAGYYDHAGQIAEKILQTSPTNASAYKSYARVLYNVGLADSAVELLKAGIQKVENGWKKLGPSLLMALNFSMAKQSTIYNASLSWAETVESKNKPLQTSTHPNKKIRLGYVSGDFKRHSVSYFIEPILENHNKDLFEIYCYSYTTNKDNITTRLKQHSDHWRDMAQLPDPKHCAEVIKKDNIDILIDLGGHTLTEALTAFTFKPARHQITYLGYPNTTGLSSINYRLTDKYADPVDQEAYYSEKLIRLDSGFLTFLPPQEAPLTTQPPSYENGFITFASFNNFAKVNDQLIELWIKILQRTPNSKLVLKGKLFNEESGRERVQNRFSMHKISPERLILIGWEQELQNHLDLYNSIDIALDTFPYNGTTTTCEALYMGVPVISLCGDDHRSRVGNSILQQMKLSTLIAVTKRDYIKKAVELANDTASLTSLKQALRPMLESSSLCDPVTTTKEIERFFISL